MLGATSPLQLGKQAHMIYITPKSKMTWSMASLSYYFPKPSGEAMQQNRGLTQGLLCHRQCQEEDVS